MPNARKKQKEDFLKRWGSVKAFGKSLTSGAVEYGKGRVRDYPKEVAVGWKHLGKKLTGQIPNEKWTMQEALRDSANVAPVAEAVGGLSVTLPQALKQLGKSAKKMRYLNREGFHPSAVTTHKQMRDFAEWKLPAENIRKMAATIRNTPKKVLEPLTSTKYVGPIRFGNPNTIARNVRIGQKGGESKIQLGPNARPEDWWHETVHSTAYAKKGERSLQGYLSDLLETSSDIAAKRAVKLNIKKGTKRKFYKDEPVEKHARLASYILPKGKDISEKEFNKIFTSSAKATLKDVKDKAPNIYKKTLKDVAKGYRQRAAQTKRVKEGKLPGTFDEWLEGVVRNPESRATGKVVKIVRRPGKKGRLKKKMTPGEIAREIQNLAEKAGPPRYLRRMAGTAELPKNPKDWKPFKIKRKAD